MTVKRKANELVYSTFWLDGMDFESAKKCALIAVDEIIIRTRSVNSMPYNCQEIDEHTKEYWQQVKQQIEKL